MTNNYDKDAHEQLGKAVIGGMLMFGTDGADVINIVAPGFFITPVQQKAFICITELFYDGIPVDEIKVAERMVMNKFYDDDTIEFLVDCIHAAPDDDDWIKPKVLALTLMHAHRLGASLSNEDESQASRGRVQ